MIHKTIKALIYLILGGISFFSCNNRTKNTSENLVIDKDAKATLPKIYGIEGKGIELRSGPSEQYDKVINQKTSDIIHETVYASVDFTVKVREDETKNGWSKVVVVDPSYLSESHQGWMLSKYLIKGNKTLRNADILTPKKIKLFNNVDAVRKLLGNNGIGELRRWRGDELGWMSSSDYYSFGNISDEFNTQNNLAYYLESNNQNSIEIVKLVLNIYNINEKKEALKMFKKIANKTFQSINLTSPKGVLDAILEQKEIKIDNKTFKTSLELEKSRIDTWKLIIETK